VLSLNLRIDKTLWFNLCWTKVKKLILLLILCFLFINSFAQAKNDSLAYQLQRKKINEMLAQRTLKFGRYQESLRLHTGIFGLQTKNDIRRSNDILMDIVKTDDAIYRELKILLEYRTFQQTSVQSKSREAENTNIGLMMNINKLRQQNDHMKTDADKQFRMHEKTDRLYLGIFIFMLASILFLLSRVRWRKA